MNLDTISAIKHKMSEDLIIFQGAFDLELQGENCPLVGVIWQDFKENMLRFEGAINKRITNKVIESFYEIFERQKQDYRLKIPHYACCKVKISTLDLAKENVINISGRIVDRSIQKEKKNHVNKIILDVCNYVQKLNVNEFSVNDWIIKVIKRGDEKSIFEKLSNSKGSIVTHRFILSKKDNSSFYTDDKELVLLCNTIDWVCSYTAARSVKISNIYGFIDTQVVWEEYRGPLVSDIKVPSNWFYPPFNEMFENLFQNVLEKIELEKWAKTLRIWLSWYIEAMGNSIIESRIVATQVALESIGWTHLIEENDLIEESSFDKLAASDKLRLLLHEFKINKIIINEERTQFLKKATWIKDGPHLITEVRNSIVHPTLKKKKQTKFEVIDKNETKLFSWLYGIHYLELSILSVLGYKGLYQSRIKYWVEYKTVPWVS